uniref:Uncharacterized protein n=1 Tax=Populus trichocarpa TaxID=3694 RepID=A0A3N7E6R5_POPTR
MWVLFCFYFVSDCARLFVGPIHHQPLPPLSP